MSKTIENLKAAFGGESEARNKYTFFAEVARKEGYLYIAKIFEETADNERQHAKDHLLLLNGIGDTVANLKAAIDGEDHEVQTMYPQFVQEAENEGDQKVANAFKQVAKIEAHHRERFKKLLAMVESGTVFQRDEPIKWKCTMCGYIVEATQPPQKCPSCEHPQKFYEPANLDV